MKVIKTKQKILDAALSILMEHGFQALTQTRIAEVAGVSQGNLTYHFPSRTELLKAVVEESKTRMSAIRAAELEAGTLTWESLENIMMQIPLSKTMPSLMLALTAARDEDPSLAEWFAYHQQTMRQNFHKVLAKLGCQADDTTLNFVRAAMLGASVIHFQQNSEASEAIVRSIMKNACEYLKQHAAPLAAQ